MRDSKISIKQCSLGPVLLVLGRIKGWLLAMLAPQEGLRVAPVPLRALDPACAPVARRTCRGEGRPDALTRLRRAEQGTCRKGVSTAQSMTWHFE
jgi:hypothetical protein